MRCSAAAKSFEPLGWNNYVFNWTVPFMPTVKPFTSRPLRCWTVSAPSATMDTLPEPNDHEVGLVTVPGETVAVLRFTGDRGSAAVAARTTELLDELKDTAFNPTGTPVGWFYDPPWTLPFRRRNEVAVPVARR